MVLNLTVNFSRLRYSEATGNIYNQFDFLIISISYIKYLVEDYDLTRGNKEQKEYIDTIFLYKLLAGEYEKIENRGVRPPKYYRQSWSSSRGCDRLQSQTMGP